MEINNHTQLKAAIQGLEAKEHRQKELLIEQFRLTQESLKPVNILKSTFSNITSSSPDGHNNLLNAALGLGAGFLSKKLFVRGSGNFLKKILGTVLELGVAKTVANHSDNVSDKIRLAGVQLLKKIFKPKAATKVY